MAVFDIEKPAEPTAWFNMEEGGRVQLCLISSDTYDEIRKQATKSKVEYAKVDGKPERFEVNKVDPDLFSKLFWGKVIVSFEGLLDKHKNPISCTDEHKALLATRSEEFALFVQEGLKKLKEDEAKRLEEVSGVSFEDWMLSNGNILRQKVFMAWSVANQNKKAKQ